MASMRRTMLRAINGVHHYGGSAMPDHLKPKNRKEKRALVKKQKAAIKQARAIKRGDKV